MVSGQYPTSHGGLPVSNYNLAADWIIFQEFKVSLSLSPHSHNGLADILFRLLFM